MTSKDKYGKGYSAVYGDMVAHRLDVNEEHLPFRCGKCGQFVKQERLHDPDDFGPAPCKKCKKGTKDG